MHLALPPLLSLLIAGLLAAADPAPQPMPAVQCTVRSGLPNVAAKLARHESVTIVVLGGSITQNSVPDGYVADLAAWVRSTYPGSMPTVINAGVGGTGSDFGAKRYDRDVLASKPDLVLVEFAVNDGSQDATVAMERIVHKTWLASPTTDLAFFYNLHREQLPAYAQGILPPAAASHERVAAFYGIPTFSPACEVQRRLASGALAWQAYSGDACHPTREGYAIINEVFRSALPGLLAAGTPGPHRLPGSLTPSLQVYPPKPVTVAMPPATLTTRDGRRARQAWALPVPGLNWVAEPSFSDGDGRVIWRINWIQGSDRSPADPAFAAERSAWEAKPGAWFAEDGYFTGGAKMVLFGQHAGGSTFGMGSGQSGILRFIAPAAGHYAIQIGIGGLSLWEDRERTLGLHLLRLGWDGKPGQPVLQMQDTTASFLTRAKAGWSDEAEADLTAGEELVLVAVSDKPGMSWLLTGLSVRVGLVDAQPGATRR